MIKLINRPRHLLDSKTAASKNAIQQIDVNLNTNATDLFITAVNYKKKKEFLKCAIILETILLRNVDFHFDLYFHLIIAYKNINHKLAVDLAMKLLAPCKNIGQLGKVHHQLKMINYSERRYRQSLAHEMIYISLKASKLKDDLDTLVAFNENMSRFDHDTSRIGQINKKDRRVKELQNQINNLLEINQVMKSIYKHCSKLGISRFHKDISLELISNIKKANNLTLDSVELIIDKHLLKMDKCA